MTNHLTRDFGAETPNAKWMTNIIYIRTAKDWLYPALVPDLFSRQVVGWSMKPQLGRELVINALLMAVWQRTTSVAVALHSDRWTQYATHEFQG